MASASSVTDRSRASMAGVWWTTITSSASVLPDETVQVVAHLGRGADGAVREHLVHVGAEASGQQLVGLLVGQILGVLAWAPAPVQADGPRSPHARSCSRAALSVSAAITLTPAIAYGCASCSEGRNSRR